MSSKLFICLSLLLLFSYTPDSSAFDLTQDVDIPSSFNPLGSGARAIGMGGAFIGVADDATAASWNPGGLIQLEEPEMSVVYSYTQRRDDKKFRTDENPDSSNTNEVDFSRVNYLSAAYPFQRWNRNMVVSLNFQHLYDLNFKGKFQIQHVDVSSEGLESDSSDDESGVQELGEDNGAEIDISEDSATSDFDLNQDGDIYALGVALSVQISPRISVGATLNYWGDIFSESGWSNYYTITSSVTNPLFSINSTGIREEKFTFEGWNFNMGILYQINDKWSVGSVFKSPFTADIVYSRRIKSTITYLPSGDIIDNSDTSDFNNSNEEMDMPTSYGVGVAYRYSDQLTLSAEVYRTHWEDFGYTKQNGITISPITGKSVDESDIDSTTWCRLGGEYLVIGNKFVVPLRAGIFYDPAPASGSPDNYYGFALGSGIAYKKWIFDLAFTHRFGKDVAADMFNIENIDFSQDVDEYNLYASIIIHL